MKITALHIQNFLGAKSVEVQIERPVNLFAGRNGAGKSSVQEAIRMALTGETGRVGLKKDSDWLLTQDADRGFVEVEINGQGRAFFTLPDCKGAPPPIGNAPPHALPYVLDAQRFTAMAPNARRAFLFGLMGLSVEGDEIKKRLLTRGCEPGKVDAIAPMLRAGFDAANKEAQARAREDKAAWRTVTGETYGEKKAATWRAQKPDFDAAALAGLRERLAAADAEMAAANQKLGALRADHNRYADAAQRLTDLRAKADHRERVAGKLAIDEAELGQWQAKVDAARQLASGGRKAGLVHDLAFCLNEVLALTMPFGNMNAHQRGQLASANAALEKYAAEHGKIASARTGDIDAQDKLPEYEKALRLMQNAVANGRRDLAQADAAASAVAELQAVVGSAPDEGAIAAATQELAALSRQQQNLSVSLDQARDAQQQAAQADERTAQALAAHESSLAWAAIADALAPDGIPGEMLAAALGPINGRLQNASENAQWMRVSVQTDMSVWAAYPDQLPRPYSILSESEKWRADAMLAEAVSHISGIRLLVLDRLDVLDIEGRADALAWLDVLAQNGDVETAMVLGTLKALPATLPPTIAAHWLENGALMQLRQAA